MQSSRLTAKYQTTIPEKVRRFLMLKKGDRVAFDIKNNQVILKKLTGLDAEYLQNVEHTLSEWSSEHDEEAFGKL